LPETFENKGFEMENGKFADAVFERKI